jgi:hypothetical protein
MEFIEYTLNWCRGEIFEGKLVFLFGAVVLVIAFLYWKFGSTPFTKAMIIPLLVVALFGLIAGGSLVVKNQKRIVDYQQAWEENPQAFVESEKTRTDNFIKWYPVTMYTLSGLTVIGLCCYAFWAGAWGRAIGLGLILLSLSGLFLDHFSEERAETYHQHIVNVLK